MWPKCGGNRWIVSFVTIIECRLPRPFRAQGTISKSPKKQTDPTGGGPHAHSGLLVNGAGARDGFQEGGIAKKPIDTPPDMLAQHKHHKRALPARRGPLFGDHFRSSSRCLFLLSFLSLRRARRAFITFLFRFECGGRGGSFDDNGVLLFLFGSVVSFSDLKQKMDAATRAIDKGRLRKLRLSPLQAGGLALPPLLVCMLSRRHGRMENIHQKKHQKKTIITSKNRHTNTHFNRSLMLTDAINHPLS